MSAQFRLFSSNTTFLNFAPEDNSFFFLVGYVSYSGLFTYFVTI